MQLRSQYSLLAGFAVLALAASTCPAQGSATSSPRALAPLLVKSDFPGGSIEVQSLDQAGRVLRFLPASHPDRGWTCWWYFKLEGLQPGSTITLDLGGTGWGQPDQAFFSYDNRHWQQTVGGVRASRRIVYRVPVESAEAWFAWGPPFVLQHAQELVADVCKLNPHAAAFELGKTREGRPVPGLKIVDQSAAENKLPAIWVQARQHAWEAGSSWVARGLAEWLVSNDPMAQSLRRRAVVYLVPVMDVDNVELGAGGKNQKPHDQNFDWGAPNYFPEVAAAMREIAGLETTGRLGAFFDLHDPGTVDRNILFYIPAQPLLTPERIASQETFFKIAREEMTGPMAFTGQLGPCGATYDPAVDRTSESWVAAHSRPALLSLTLETPWNTPASTKEGYLKTGEQLGRSIERYLPKQAEARP
jgi:hypothetical protein